MRIIFILLLVISLKSCDRNAPEPSDEGMIIGFWENGSERAVSINGSLLDTTRTCRNIPFTEFSSDGALNFQLRKAGGPQLCIPDTTFSANGTWERLKNEKYQLFLSNTIGKSDTIIEPVRIYFTDEGNIMNIQFEPVIDKEGEEAFYFETTFFRKK